MVKDVSFGCPQAGSGPALRRLGLLALAGAAGLFACARQVRVDAPARHNLLLVTVARMDTRAFDAAWRAELETPALDALCAGGVAFSNASGFSGGDGADLATVFTGLHPRSHGTYAFFYDLDPRLDTLAELARAGGYRTGGFSVLTPSSDFPGFRQGFDAFDAPAMGESWDKRRPNDEVLGAALRWMRAAERDGRGPWFCWIHLGVPNALGEDLSEAQLRSLPRDMAREDSLRLIGGRTAPSDRITLTDLNNRLGLVAFDQDVADLVEFVGEHAPGSSRGRAGTVVGVVTALSGANADLFPRLHGRSVPLLVASTGALAKHVDDRDATLADVLPTLLASAGLGPAADARLDGIDLMQERDPGPRLLVLDRAELGQPLETAARLGNVMVGITEEFQWIRGIVDGDAMTFEVPQQDVDTVLAAYHAWTRGRPEADSSRDFGLEMEFVAQAEAWMREHFPEFAEDR